MPLSPNTELYQLVLSLSSQERDQYKAHMLRNSRKDLRNSLDLFQAVCDSNSTDEDLLKRTYAGKPFTKNLSYEKNRLREKLLEALRENWLKREGSAMGRNRLHEAQLLFARGEFKMCKTRLELAHKFALKNEDDALCLDVLDLKRELTRRTFDKKTTAALQAIQQEKEALLEKIVQKHQLEKLSDRLFLLVRKKYRLHQAIAQEELEELKVLLAAADPAELGSHALDMLFLFCQALRDQLEHNVKAAYGIYQHLVQFFEQHPYLRTAQPNQYRLTLANFLHMAHHLSYYDQFRQILEQLEDLRTLKVLDQIEAFQSIDFFEFIWKMNTGQLDEAQEMIPNIQKGLHLFGDKMVPSLRLGLQYNLGILYFVLGYFEQAQECFAPLVNSYKSPVRKDLIQMAQVFDVVISFELRDVNYLHSHSLAVLRKLKRSNELSAFSRRVLLFMGKLANRAEDESSDFFSSFLGDLESDHREKSQAAVQGFYEILIWCRSRAQGISMEEACRNFIAEMRGA